MLVVTVLKSGGVYTPEYVYRLKEHFSDFVCFSDIPLPGVMVIPLTNNWAGWWSKIELFKVDLGKVFYLDLDTVIDGDVSHILEYPHKFTMLRDFFRPTIPASGLMAWEGDYTHIYNEYRHGAPYPGHGDQGYIASKVSPEFFQDLFPNDIDSYKVAKLPDPRIVCYHGTPKPHETGWAKNKT